MGIEQQICDAVQLIVNRSIENAGYDKTIKATVLECVDAALGKYKLEYQDAIIIAYSETPYPVGTLVNISVPNGDMSSTKKILSAASINTLPYTDVVESENLYEQIGNTLLKEEKNSVELCGYESQTKMLFRRGESNNILHMIDDREVLEYIQEADTLGVMVDIHTTLPLELQKDGDYGLIIVAAYTKEDNISDQVLIPYNFDSSFINGNPYLLLSPDTQKAYFPIESEKFKHIEAIYAYTKNFPIQSKNKSNNIFFNNIKLLALREYEDEELNGGNIKLVAKQGLIFKESDIQTAKKAVEPFMFINGKQTNTNLKYYWFKENGTITTTDRTKYNSYGGAGWECLNTFNKYTADGVFLNETEELPTDGIIEWIPFELGTLTITKENITTRKQKFKCVIICDGVPYEKELTVTNYGSPYNVEISSSDGLHFYNGYGTPILTCKVIKNNIEITDLSNYEFIWSDLDTDSQDLFDENAERFSVLEKGKIKAYISSISRLMTYKCSVVENVNGVKVPRGDAAITLTNSESEKSTYSLVMKHAEHIFKYNNNNIAPTSDSLDDPLELKPLTFSFFDPEGREIKAEDIIKMGGKIIWSVPIQSMLHTRDAQINKTDSDYEYYYNVATLGYELNPTYQGHMRNNNISLEVQYKGVILTTSTNFTILKDGEIGTNGTEYICRIIPMKDTLEYPTLTVNSSNTPFRANFTKTGSASNNDSSFSWFKAQLFQGSKEIGDWTLNKSNSDIKWYFMNYKDGVEKGNSNFSLKNAGNGGYYISYTGDKTLPTNLLKAEITKDEKVYTAILPILTAKVSDTRYDIKLKQGTGFTSAMYMEDGTYPSYNDTYPFEIELTYDGVQQNINLAEYSVKWSIINGGERFNGTYQEQHPYLEGINNYALDATVQEYRAAVASANSLSEEERKARLREIENTYRLTLLPNRRKIYPSPLFESESTSNAVQVEILRNGNFVASLHIPIYLYLNSFGKSAINGWDGNSVTNGDDYILAPQVGAGRKENDNTFTGMVMGVVKHTGNGSEDVGLFAYNRGTRNIFLNSEDGSAHFGHGNCSIDIEPGVDGADAIFRGGGYDGVKKQGFELNLSAPSMTYGNGKYKVTPEGILYATGAHFTNGTITLGTATEPEIFKLTPEGYMTLTRGQITLGKNGSKDTFSLTDEGILTMTQGSITLGKNQEKPAFRVDDDGILTMTRGAISLGYDLVNERYNYNVDDDGKMTVYKGSIAIGKRATDETDKTQDLNWNFQVKSNGQGNFGVWAFTNTKMFANLTNGGVFELSRRGISLTDGTNTIFSANRTSGQIGYWTFNRNELSNGESNGTQVSFGSSGLSIGNYVSIPKNGHFTFGNTSTNKYISFNGTDIEFGSAVTLTWGAVSERPTKLSEFTNDQDYKSGTQVTEITQNTVTTSYVNALGITASYISADGITAGTISGSTIDISTRVKVKDGSGSYSTLYPGYFKLRADSDSVAGTISTDLDSITFNKRIMIGNDGTAPVYCGTIFGTQGHVETDYLDVYGKGENSTYLIRVNTNATNGGIQGNHLLDDDGKGYGWHFISYVSWADGSTHHPNRSDKRGKVNIKNLSEEESLFLLRNVKSKTFNYKRFDGQTPILEDVNCGFIAQDVRDSLIKGGFGYRTYLQIHIKDTEDYTNNIYEEEDKVGYFLEYEKMLPIVWTGWQIHDNEITLLKQEIQELKNKLKQAGIE